MRRRLFPFAFLALAACQSPAAPPEAPEIQRAEPQPAPTPLNTAAPPAPLPESNTAAPLVFPPVRVDALPDDYPHGGAAREAADIDLIVVHTIGGAECKDGRVVFTPANGSAVFWRDWFLRQTDKSIHYVIDREGLIAQQRPDLRTAGHVSAKDVMPDINRRSIGIELVNRGDGIDPFPEAQILALKSLLHELATKHQLPPEALRTHAELDPRMQADCGGQKLKRNVDPGPLFPLEAARTAMVRGQ